MNVSGRHMSSFKYEFHGFSHMNYKFAGAWRVWKYKCKRREWKDVVIRAVGKPLVLSYKTVHDEERHVSIVVFFYAFTGAWFRAIPFDYYEVCSNGQVLHELRRRMVLSGTMSCFQKLYYWDKRHVHSKFDWDSYPVEADDLNR